MYDEDGMEERLYWSFWGDEDNSEPIQDVKEKKGTIVNRIMKLIMKIKRKIWEMKE